MLGIEGDPMRLLFDRDLTPHPQYAAFYKWLESGFKADAVVRCRTSCRHLVDIADIREPASGSLSVRNNAILVCSRNDIVPTSTAIGLRFYLSPEVLQLGYASTSALRYPNWETAVVDEWLYSGGPYSNGCTS